MSYNAQMISLQIIIYILMWILTSILISFNGHLQKIELNDAYIVWSGCMWPLTLPIMLWILVAEALALLKEKARKDS